VTGNAPLFAPTIVGGIRFALLVLCLAVEAWSLIHCLLQRAEAFTSAGKLSKWAWVGINIVGVFLTLLFGTLGIFGLLAITAALVYLLDVRPAVREVSGGGPW
jgi:hypothetical protein